MYSYVHVAGKLLFKARYQLPNALLGRIIVVVCLVPPNFVVVKCLCGGVTLCVLWACCLISKCLWPNTNRQSLNA